jgi:hypothetical protein
VVRTECFVVFIARYGLNVYVKCVYCAVWTEYLCKMFPARYGVNVYVNCVSCAVRTECLCKVCLLRGTD